MDVIFCGVHTIERDNSAPMAINDRKASRLRASAYDDVVMPDRESDGLESQIVLVPAAHYLSPCNRRHRSVAAAREDGTGHVLVRLDAHVPCWRSCARCLRELRPPAENTAEKQRVRQQMLARNWHDDAISSELGSFCQKSHLIAGLIHLS